MSLVQTRLVYDIGGSGYNRRATSGIHCSSGVVDPDASDLTAMSQAAYDKWAGASVTMKAYFPADTQFVKAESWTEELVADPDYPSPGHPTPYVLNQISIPYASTGAEIAGTDTGDANPPQVALVVTLRSELAGRSHRGRVYLPPISFDRSGVDGEIDQAFCDDVAEGFGLLHTAVGAAVAGVVDMVPCIVSRKLGSTTQIVQWTCGNRIDTQRRRLRRQV